MINSDPTAVEAIDKENPRVQRQLTKCMPVLLKDDDIYTMVGEHGHIYSADAREGRCTCPDAKYNLKTGQSYKHKFRTLVVADRCSALGWTDSSAIDEISGGHANGFLRLIASDSGKWITDTAGLADKTASERLGDCNCPGNSIKCSLAGTAIRQATRSRTRLSSGKRIRDHITGYITNSANNSVQEKALPT